MRILSRYFLARFLSWFGMVLLVLCVGVLIAEMLLHLDTLTEAADGFAGAVRFLAIKICAYYLPLLIPIASFVAAFLSVGLAARGLEVTAAKAGGVSPRRLVGPVLAAAAVLSGLALLVNETLVLQSERAWRRHESGGAGEIEFRRGSFWYHTGRFIYNVGDADPDTRTLHDLRVFEMTSEGRLVRRIHAGVARVADGELHLFDATVRRFDLETPLEPPERGWEQKLVLDTGSTSDPTLLEADATTLSLANLWEFIRRRAQQGGDVTRFRAALHSRLTDPLSVFLLALLALPFALRVDRTQSLAVQALGGVVVMLVFWSARSASTLLAPVTPAAAVALPWTLVGLFLLVGAWRFARVPS